LSFIKVNYLSKTLSHCAVISVILMGSGCISSRFVCLNVGEYVRTSGIITVLVILMLFFTPCLQAREGVVLLHGLARSSSSMQKMEAALQMAGYLVVNHGYPSRTASIESLSDEAIGSALKRPDLNDCAKIHFVTHSLGGILVRSYFKRHEFPRLGRVVMLGPPNQGSEVVDEIGSLQIFQSIHGPAGRELGTGNHSTPNQLGPVNFELGIIAGDRSINWINSMMIIGKDDGKVSVERTKVEGMKEHIVIHSTHPYLMKNRTAIAMTIRFLQSGTFREPSPPQSDKEY
jgi:triacylglycerol lipase